MIQGTSTSGNSWRALPFRIGLGAGHVHVWSAELSRPTAQVRELTRFLAPDEYVRAQGFRFERDRRRFIVARGLLRVLAGRYLDADPAQLSFGHGRHGKPFLTDGCQGCDIQFNVARSHKLALLAFARSRRIGVDLERSRQIPEMAQIVGRVFTEQEQEVWVQTPSDQKLEAFYCTWTRKEAILKAFGQGLAYPMNTLDVGVKGDPSSPSFPVDQISTLAACWSLLPMFPAPGYVAALAVEGTITRLQRWMLA